MALYPQGAPRRRARPQARVGLSFQSSLAKAAQAGARAPMTSTLGASSAQGFAHTPTAPKPPAAPGTPPGSSSPAPAGLAPLPVDPLYQKEEAALRDRRDQILAGLSDQRTRGLLDYGYTEDTAGGLQFDPRNSLSRAAQMKRRYDQARGSSNSQFAARGHLYSGANRGARDELNFQQLGSEDALMKSLGEFLAGNRGAKGRAESDYEMGRGEAEGRRVERAPDNPLYEPTAPAPEAARAAKPQAAPSKPKAKAKASAGQTGLSWQSSFAKGAKKRRKRNA